MPKSLPANSHQKVLQKNATNVILTWPIELVASFSYDTEERDKLLHPARATTYASSIKDFEGTQRFDACYLASSQC